VLCGDKAGRRGAGIVLNSSPAQFLGGISYSVYLAHWPLLIIPVTVVGASGELATWVRVVLALIAVPIAWLLYRFVEQPLRSSAVVLVLGAGVAIASRLAPALVPDLGAVPTLPLADLRLSAGGPVSAEASAADSASPRFATFVPTNLDPPLVDAKSDIPI